ncbi:hypothetical protein DICVIV_02051 [Dictyocaulus viviparus]|uniref:PNPLA domain-containing protein n=1 Tax=Dictyocaulus viviparus TaxID=29172 RepID=A0A0D8Y4V3_DICVI|nr:hypothetical protein DICVIV_02051 [Dictyocaulus viviparus]
MLYGSNFVLHVLTPKVKTAAQVINVGWKMDVIVVNNIGLNYAKRVLNAMVRDATMVLSGVGRLFDFARNYSFTRAFGIAPNEEDVMFKDAARASSAAPTYFEPFLYKGKKFVDGSFVANYPVNILFKPFASSDVSWLLPAALAAPRWRINSRALEDKRLLVEVDSFATHNNEIRLAGIVSIGTGEPAQAERKYNIGTTLKSKAKNISRLSALILEQVVGQDLATVEMAQERCQAHNIPFIRISPKIDNLHEVDKLAELLFRQLSNTCDRKRRSNTYAIVPLTSKTVIAKDWLNP